MSVHHFLLCQYQDLGRERCIGIRHISMPIPIDWNLSPQNHQKIHHHPNLIVAQWSDRSCTRLPTTQSTWVTAFCSIERIIIIAWTTIKNALFNVTCPNTVNKPSAALESITQDYYGNLGNVITLSVHLYFQHVCHAIRAMGQNFSYCAESHLMNNLPPQVKKEVVESGWTNHQG